MTFKEWLPVAELVGIIAVVASLIFVGMEIRQSRDIARTEWTAFHTDEQTSLETLIADHIETWHRGCSGAELTELERAEYARLFSAFYHVAWERWIRASIGITGANPAFVSKEYAKNIHRYPGFETMWATWKGARVGGAMPSQEGIVGFPEEVDAWVGVLEAEEPKPDYDLAFCGVWTS